MPARPLALTPDQADTAYELWRTGQAYTDIAEQFRVAPNTVRRYVLEKHTKSEEAKYFHEHLPELIEQKAVEVLHFIDSDSIEKASLQQRATTFAILTDKMRLLRGESTANIAVNESIMIINKRARDARLTTIQSDNSQAPTEE